jgi:hypothetical protein
MTTWKITQLDRLTSDGYVTTAHWTASQTDGEFTASTYSTASFPEVEGDMIPYADLTEEEVIGWVKASLGAEGVAAVDSALAANIADQKAPKTATGTPWSA